jgi:hypothetical protein
LASYPAGYDLTMSEERIESRAAHLLPEERTVGSDDPEAQAEAILVESDVREERPAATTREHRSSEEAV